MNKGDAGVSACGKAEGNARLGSFSSSPPRPGRATFSLAAGTSCMLLHRSQLFGLTSLITITITFPLHHYLKSTQLEGILIVSHFTCMQTAVCTGLCSMFFSNGSQYQSNCWCHLFCLINSWPFQGTLSTALAEGHRAQQRRCKRRQSGESSAALETTSTDYFS